jgi:hypothetical protein
VDHPVRRRTGSGALASRLLGTSRSSPMLLAVAYVLLVLVFVTITRYAMFWLDDD